MYLHAIPINTHLHLLFQNVSAVTLPASLVQVPLAHNVYHAQEAYSSINQPTHVATTVQTDTTATASITNAVSAVKPVQPVQEIAVHRVFLVLLTLTSIPPHTPAPHLVTQISTNLLLLLVSSSASTVTLHA